MIPHPHFSLIPLEQAQPGMVLSEDILDHRGLILLAKGTTLSAHMLAALSSHNVLSLPVEVTPLSNDEIKLRATHEAERIEHVFRHRDTQSMGAARMLYELVKEYRLGSAV